MNRFSLHPSIVPAVWALALGAFALAVGAWTPVPVADDPLVRMPGTQAGDLTNVEAPTGCTQCHDFASDSSPFRGWQGSMMSQSARDFLFFATLTVAIQDSIWAIDRPNAADFCLRCHFPQGWVEGRSEPVSGSSLTGPDWDGVHCGVCHRLMDPFFEATWSGAREGNDWEGYWDESGVSATPSQGAADATRSVDGIAADSFSLFDGELFYTETDLPVTAGWTEAGSGQLFFAPESTRRASFADANPNHAFLYSRAHKSRYFCGSCHDVSNPVFANLDFAGTPPGDGTTRLPTETDPAFSYFHAERTFSEFSLSDFGLLGGAPGAGPWAPEVFETSSPGNAIARCQDCHLRDVVGRAASQNRAILRPDESVEHPKSGAPSHDMTGGNLWVSRILASAVSGSPTFDATNAQLLGQGPAVLTLDLAQGLEIDPVLLEAGAVRAGEMLARAAVIEDVEYEPTTGEASLRIRNLTGHKLPTGYPEGRRAFLNLRLWSGDALLAEVNPYSEEAGTLAGLGTASSPPLEAWEEHVGELVYEAQMASSLVAGEKTFHFALADGRFKDNRIPPRGFRIGEASARLAEPVEAGESAPGMYETEEYAGGLDAVELNLPTGGDRLEAELHYQVTSREYVEFLRDEIEGTATSLPSEAYVAQTDPFFDGLRAWGSTVWDLWLHNRDLPGGAPVLLATGLWEDDGAIFADGFESGDVGAWSN